MVFVFVFVAGVYCFHKTLRMKNTLEKKTKKEPFIHLLQVFVVSFYVWPMAHRRGILGRPQSLQSQSCHWWWSLMSHWTANQQTDCFCAMEIRKPELSGVVLVFLSSFLGFYAGKRCKSFEDGLPVYEKPCGTRSTWHLGHIPFRSDPFGRISILDRNIVELW